MHSDPIFLNYLFFRTFCYVINIHHYIKGVNKSRFNHSKTSSWNSKIFKLTMLYFSFFSAFGLKGGHYWIGLFFNFSLRSFIICMLLIHYFWMVDTFWIVSYMYGIYFWNSFEIFSPFFFVQTMIMLRKTLQIFGAIVLYKELNEFYQIIDLLGCERHYH